MTDDPRDALTVRNLARWTWTEVRFAVVTIGRAFADVLGALAWWR